MKKNKTTPVIFLVVVNGFKERTIVASSSAGKARYKIYRSLKELGYRQSFKDIRIKRAPEYDSLAGYLSERKICIDLSYADELMKEGA